MKKIIIPFLFSFLISAETFAQWDVSVAKYKDNKKCAISYTFDDGLAEHYSLVMPKFRSLGFSATFWINGSNINHNEESVKDTTRMTWGQLRQLSDMGHEISNHGWAHKNFARFPLDEIRVDIEKNDSAIMACTGKKPLTFCYPNNNKQKDAMAIAVKNRVDTRTFQRSIGSKSTPDDLRKWTDNLILTGEWGVGMTHGITYGYDAFRDPRRFWDHLDYVKSRREYIWVATFLQVASYKKEAEAVSLDVQQKKNKLTVTPSINLDRELFKEPLTMLIKGGKINKVTVKQGKKVLKAKIKADTLLFDFDPFGQPVTVKFK